MTAAPRSAHRKPAGGQVAPAGYGDSRNASRGSTGLLSALFAAAGLAAPALAGDPPAGAPVAIIETVLCDTLDQIEAVRAAASSGGWPAAAPIVSALIARRNEIGEPACGVVTSAIVVTPVAVIGAPVLVDGREVWIWAILWTHREAGEQTGYVLMPTALAAPQPKGVAL